MSKIFDDSSWPIQHQELADTQPLSLSWEDSPTPVRSWYTTSDTPTYTAHDMGILLGTATNCRKILFIHSFRGFL